MAHIAAHRNGEGRSQSGGDIVASRIVSSFLPSDPAVSVMGLSGDSTALNRSNKQAHKGNSGSGTSYGVTNHSKAVKRG